jgi:hypothetical protein
MFAHHVFVAGGKPSRSGQGWAAGYGGQGPAGHFRYRPKPVLGVDLSARMLELAR